MSTFQPSTTLLSRTFIGLLIAQFLAAFNDQAIHASAMFFAIKHKTMTEAGAITLMPILFYAPWALFGTISGWLADRYSKRNALVIWKIAEIVITGVALLGFWLGAHHIGFQLGPIDLRLQLGPILVLSTVFLMGTHSTFFVPAKYGCMPEILTPQLLSRGNGMLESLSFLAIILGTVCGGVMSYVFGTLYPDQEYWIGVVLVSLAIIGALASFIIAKMPAANPTRPFPYNPFWPIYDNLRVMLRSRPLAVAVVGIAFFTFVVAYMRAVMYMHGQTRNPPWNELDTSLIVGTVMFGLGLGSPLAGFLSGGKVELGLVPFGGIGMVFVLAIGSFILGSNAALIVCLILVGFCTGFYLVPLYTLLQFRAPKQSKGDLLATSNMINVVGAIAASGLFAGLIAMANWSGITPTIQPREDYRGKLVAVERDGHGHITRFQVEGRPEYVAGDDLVIKRREGYEVGLEKGTEVVLGTYRMERQGKLIDHILIQRAEFPILPTHDRQRITGFLFLGAAVMTFCILFLLRLRLPDLFLRMLIWLRRVAARRRITVVGLGQVPTSGAVILATSADSFDTSLLVLSAVDRYTRFLLVEAKGEFMMGLAPVLARSHGLGVLKQEAAQATEWNRVEWRAKRR